MNHEGTIKLSVSTEDIEATIVMHDDEGLQIFLKNLAHITRMAGYDYVKSLEVVE